MNECRPVYSRSPQQMTPLTGLLSGFVRVLLGPKPDFETMVWLGWHKVWCLLPQKTDCEGNAWIRLAKWTHLFCVPYTRLKILKRIQQHTDMLFTMFIFIEHFPDLKHLTKKESQTSVELIRSWFLMIAYNIFYDFVYR